MAEDTKVDETKTDEEKHDSVVYTADDKSGEKPDDGSATGDGNVTVEETGAVAVEEQKDAASVEADETLLHPELPFSAQNPKKSAVVRTGEENNTVGAKFAE